MVLVALSLSTRPARAAFELGDQSWEGCSDLLDLARAELGANRVVTTKTLDWHSLGPNDAILVIHPLSPIDPEEAASFMRAGGRLGLFDDFGVGDRLLRTFNVEVRELPKRPALFLRGNEALAVARPVRETIASGEAATHPTVADVATVIFNHGIGYRHPELTAVLEVSSERPVSGELPEAVPVAIAGQVDKGRLFAVGDASAFMNLMLRFSGNREFARGVLRYLADGEKPQRRDGRLVIVVNEFGESGSFAGETTFEKSLTRFLRVMALGLEELSERGFPGWLHRIAGGLCGLGLIGWFARSAMSTYAPRLPRFARPVPLAAQGGIAGRLAVLASPTTSPDLAMLEVRSALAEALASSLSARLTAPLDELVQRAAERFELAPALVERVHRVHRWASDAESAVLSGTRSRVRQRQVLEAARIAEEVIEEVLAKVDPGRRP